MCVGFVLFSRMLFPERKKKIGSVLTGVDILAKKKKKKGGGSRQARPRTKCYEEMVGEAAEGGGGGKGKQTRIEGTPASNSDLTVI